MLFIAPSQEAYEGYFFNFLQHVDILCVLIRIASSRRFLLVHTIYHFQYKKENHPKFNSIIPNLQLLGFSKGLYNKFETAMVNKPSVFEPLKFHCTIYSLT